MYAEATFRNEIPAERQDAIIKLMKDCQWDISFDEGVATLMKDTVSYQSIDLLIDKLTRLGEPLKALKAACVMRINPMTVRLLWEYDFDKPRPLVHQDMKRVEEHTSDCFEEMLALKEWEAAI